MTDTEAGNSRGVEGPVQSESEEHRMGKSHDRWRGIDGCREKLLEDAEAIRILERLTGRGPTLVDDAVDIFVTSKTTRDAKVYQSFLYDVLRHSGPGIVVLCAASLGKQRVVHLNEKDRTGLVGWIRDNKPQLHSLALDSLADEYDVPSAGDDRIAHVIGGSRKRVRKTVSSSSSRKSDHPRAELQQSRPTATIPSPAILHQDDSILPTAQPLQLDTQTGPETSCKHGRVLISNIMNPAPEKQPDMRIHSQVTDEPASKRPRLGPRQISWNLVLPGDGQYCSFSFMSRHRVENLPEPFRTGIKMSNLWRKETESGGLAVTNCMSLYLPETDDEDGLFVARIGCDDGFNICNMFGFGDPDVPVSEEGTAEEARN